MIRILIVAGYPIVKHMLKLQIELEPDLLVVGEREMGSTVAELVGQLEPDVILVDLDTPGEAAIASARTLHADFPQIPVLIISLDENEDYQKLAAKVGAAGFVRKQSDPALLIESIRRAAAAAAE